MQLPTGELAYRLSRVFTSKGRHLISQTGKIQPPQPLRRTPQLCSTRRKLCGELRNSAASAANSAAPRNHEKYATDACGSLLWSGEIFSSYVRRSYACSGIVVAPLLLLLLLLVIVALCIFGLSSVLAVAGLTQQRPFPIELDDPLTVDMATRIVNSQDANFHFDFVFLLGFPCYYISY